MIGLWVPVEGPASGTWIPTNFHDLRPALQRIPAPRAETRPLRIRLLAARARKQCRARRARRKIERNLQRLIPARHRNPKRRRDARRLNCVELPHPSRHEEALDEAKNPRKRRPEEAEIKNAEPVTPQVEVVRAKAAQEKRKQNPDHLVTAHILVLLVKNGLRIHVWGGGHCRFSSLRLPPRICNQLRGSSTAAALTDLALKSC